MRGRLVALFFIGIALAWSGHAFAATIDSQLDSSASATRPAPASVYLALGYVPQASETVYGVRFRVNTSGSGDYICPVSSSIMKYSGTTTPPTQWGTGWNVVGRLVNVGTTTPDSNGFCDYTTLDKYDKDVSLALSPSYYYVFFMSTGGSSTKWVSVNGKPYTGATPSLFGFRHALLYDYEWGTTGLDAPYYQFYDTPPPTTPTLTLTGSATTTAEYKSTFTDPGATASDTIDGNITSSIQVTGSVNTSTMGTTTLTYAVTNSSGLTSTTTRTVVVSCTQNCYSNVLFLPGIKGSHLYRPKDGCDANLSSCKDRLWEPGLDEGIFASLLRGAGNDDVRDLFLDSNGASVREDVYVKEKDILDSVGGKDFYASFIADMDALKADGTIIDWEPAAYDWRLSLTDIVNKGRETGGRISYLEATSTPYIEQTLRALVASSKTGKVTIVAHSNGGLVAKALIARLGDEIAKSLVDNIIFVGVPQSGAPRAVGSLLYGTGEGLPLESFDFLLSKAVAREFSENSPMAYHLLPSAQYFMDTNDASHAVGTFTGTGGFAKEREAYGSTIDTENELYDFLLARDGGREKPSASNVSDANVLNETLIDYARDTHSTYDAWLPPPEITLYQVAGWGVDTVAGLRFTELPLAMVGPYAAIHRNMFSPTFIEDGDGVVPVPSALMTSTSSPNVMRYWVDLDEFKKTLGISRKHGDLMETSKVREFIENVLIGKEDILPDFIKTQQPPALSGNKKLIFILHSPLTLQLTDSSGNITGLSDNDTVAQNIPNATYGEFGEVKYIIAPEGNYTLSMNGQADGTFTLEMQEMAGNIITASSTIANVPTTVSTLASITISGGIDNISALIVDEDGDGSTDITITPEAGETINYEPPTPEPEPVPEPQMPPSGSGGGWATVPVSVPIVTTSLTADPELRSASTTTTLSTGSGQAISPQATTPVIQTVSTGSTSSPQAIIATTQKSTQTKKELPATTVIDKKQEAVTEEKAENIPQTASVYDAVSQQSVLKRLGAMVYNGFHSLWRALMRFF